MFTLHYMANPTTLGEAVHPIEWSSQHASTARREAECVARGSGRAVAVMRNGRASYVMMPDGSRKPPPLARVPERAACTRDNGRPCFCMACRAERRGAR